MVVNVVKIYDRPAIGDAQEKAREAIPASSGRRWIVREARAEIRSAARSGWLKNGELFEANLGAELERMATFDPSEIVGKDIAVLLLDRR
jgi:hypothetical protein